MRLTDLYIVSDILDSGLNVNQAFPRMTCTEWIFSTNINCTQNAFHSLLLLCDTFLM